MALHHRIFGISQKTKTSRQMRVTHQADRDCDSTKCRPGRSAIKEVTSPAGNRRIMNDHELRLKVDHARELFDRVKKIRPLGGELASGPVDGLASDLTKLTAEFRSEQRLFMVSHHHQWVAIEDQVEAFDWIGPIPHDVAKTDQSIDSGSVERCKD